MSEYTKLSVENRKYTFVIANGHVHCLRFGEPWVTFDSGSKAIIALVHAFAEMTELLPSKDVLDHIKEACRRMGTLNHNTIAWLTRVERAVVELEFKRPDPSKDG